MGPRTEFRLGLPFCPGCGVTDSYVRSTKHIDGGKYRRTRVCNHCLTVFHTTQLYEVISDD